MREVLFAVLLGFGARAPIRTCRRRLCVRHYRSLRLFHPPGDSCVPDFSPADCPAGTAFDALATCSEFCGFNECCPRESRISGGGEGAAK